MITLCCPKIDITWVLNVFVALGILESIFKFFTAEFNAIHIQGISWLATPAWSQCKMVSYFWMDCNFVYSLGDCTTYLFCRKPNSGSKPYWCLGNCINFYTIFLLAPRCMYHLILSKHDIMLECNVSVCLCRSQVDGLLFYHGEALYEAGRTPLTCWLLPHMLSDIVGVAPSDAFLSNCIPGEKCIAFGEHSRRRKEEDKMSMDVPWSTSLWKEDGAIEALGMTRHDTNRKDETASSSAVVGRASVRASASVAVSVSWLYLTTIIMLPRSHKGGLSCVNGVLAWQCTGSRVRLKPHIEDVLRAFCRRQSSVSSTMK